MEILQQNRIARRVLSLRDRTRRAALVTILLLAMATPLWAQTVEQWQRAAVQKYPALGQAGSPLNQRFLAILAEKRKSEPAYFVSPNWPLRVADAAAVALQAEEAAAKAKVPEAPPAAGADKKSALSPEEQKWEKNKAHWVFERLVFGDDEEVIARKLYLSKTLSPRVSAGARMELDSRFEWVMGESKFRLSFEMKDGLGAITMMSVPQGRDALDSLVKEDWEKLRAAAIEKFGLPAKTTDFPAAGKLTGNGWTVTDSWEKPTRIKLGIVDDGAKCGAGLRVSDPARTAE